MPKEAGDPREFHDLQGRSYACDLAAPLGRGGQGMVLAVRDDVYSAVKIVCDKGEPCTDAASRELYGRTIRALGRLPIPEGCQVSMPVALLADVAGYVMRLLGEMHSLNSMLPERTPQLLTADGMPAWVEGVADDDRARRFVSFYARSGGLRHRLKILLHLADTLGALHGEGLLFGDLSPNNVFIGRSGEVWLIDTDNIEYDGLSRSFIHTPGYGSPEIVRGEEPVSIAGDAYSFALLAFETLTLSHPFLSGCAGDGMDVEPAERGEVPWICDSEDASNRAVSPWLTQTLTPALFRLFAAMFEEGRLHKGKRPQIWMFREALARALDMSVRCPACGMSVVAAEPWEHTCRFCEAALSPLLVIHAGEMPVFVHEAEGTFTVPWRIFGPQKHQGHALRFEWQGERGRAFPGGVPGDVLYSEGGNLMPCPEVLEFDKWRLTGGLSFALRNAAERPVVIGLREG